ncbi:MAG: metallophosphoesterase family protein [Clostridia bacterium]|nr:metallophosphoesterase family protein [Clostridia bacterium]
MKRTVRILTVLLLTAVLTAAPLVSCEKSAEPDPMPAPAPSSAPKTEAVPADEPEPAAEAPWTEPKQPLRFGEDGEFCILVFSDIHGGGATISSLAKTNVALLVEREDPDFVFFDGDNTWGLRDEATVKSCVGDMVEVLEERHIPWAHVYGNHDAEGSNLKKETQQRIYESFDYCVSQAGDPALPGVGNYVLPVYSADGSRVLFDIWALDSGQYITAEERVALEPVGGIFQGYANSSYDYIRPSQIAWYRETSTAIEDYCGAKIPGLMAFHIPLQETYAAWVNRSELEHTGEKREAVCASEINSGLFAALLERGDVRAVVNGHDHVNDYMVNYGGIKLCYCSTVSETGYCDMDMLGARVFMIREDDPADVRTYMSYVDERRMEDTAAYAETGPLPGGVLLDFETYEPEIEKCGWDNNYNENAFVDQITVEIADGRGVNGSRALGVGRLNFGDSPTANNAEVKIPLETPGTLGELRYLRVWMDLRGEGTPIDFRKACFGLIVNDMYLMPYRTDDLDSPSPFWFLSDSGTEWKEMSHGGDGCFGRDQDSSVRGLRGWFAFPVENMLKRSTLDPLTDASCVTGVYFYYCLSSAEMAGQSVYLDEISLVTDYTDFH